MAPKRSVQREPSTPVKKPRVAASQPVAEKANSTTTKLSKLQRAAAALRPNSTIGSYPCREEQQQGIFEHLKTAVQEGGSTQVLYMSGMPGTGKTAVFLDTIDKLRNERGIPNFVFAHVNAMRLGCPAAVFSAIVKQVPNKAISGKSTANAAWSDLENFFTGRSELDPVVLLLIDEIDQLVTRNQAVLYHIFSWLLTPSSRLVVSAISNTMDLAERLLPRVCSRFSILRVDYKAYTRDQISRILTERLKQQEADDVFTNDALRLCAARVASAGGDLRKALQLCLRAVELKIDQCKGEDCGTVDTRQVAAATKDLLYSNGSSDAVRGLSVKARRILLALILELKHHCQPSVRKVLSRYGKLAEATGLHGSIDDFGAPSWADEGMYLLKRLEKLSLLQIRALQPGSAVVELLDLKIDDLAPLLREVEEDSYVRTLIGK